ncbi:MAG: response regulator transcription factor, partial [Fulvivirga sp.]|nr:response regulator transcription factor [Fulvivirga sp.]
TKPFSMKELIYRIEVFLKRSRQTPKDHSKRYELGSSSFDFDNLELTVGEEEHTLTEKEAMVLKMLCEHKGRVLKREEILEQVWGTNDYFLGRSMDVFISKLRKYLKADPSVKISNIHGVGFKLE